MPATAKSQSKTGSPPAADRNSRRKAPRSSVANTARSHKARRMLVADDDHGSETATPTASQPASRSNVRRSSPLTRSAVITVIDDTGYNTWPEDTSMIAPVLLAGPNESGGLFALPGGN